MNILEAVEQSGLSKENIRYYEMRGLFGKERTEDDAYQHFEPADIERLILCKNLRLAGVSLAEIIQVFQGQLPLEEALMHTQQSLMICMAAMPEEAGLQSARDALARFQEGGLLNGLLIQSGADLLDDYKAIHFQHGSVFYIESDTACATEKELTKLIYSFGQEKCIDLLMVEESLFPVIMLDGELYDCERIFTAGGMQLKCTKRKNWKKHGVRRNTAARKSVFTPQDIYKLFPVFAIAVLLILTGNFAAVTVLFMVLVIWLIQIFFRRR